MKIMMLCPYFPPDANAAAARARAFAKYFHREGAEVDVVVPDTTRIPEVDAIPGVSVSRIDNYDSIREKNGRVNSLIRFPWLVRKLRRLIETAEPNIVMTTTPSPFFAFEGLQASRRINIPTVFDVRDTWLMLSGSRPGIFGNYMKRRMEGQCCWGARKVLVVTSLLGDQLVEDHGLPRERIALASNGADIEMFDVSSNPDVDVIILGAPSTYRNFERVFQALSMLVKRRPSTSIRYVGWVDNEYSLNLKTVARNLDLMEKIEFLPSIQHTEVPAALARARVGLISISSEPAYRTAVGAKTYEYLAAGLPLACFGPPTDCELRRLWQTTQAGIYESEPARFAEHLERVLDDESLRKSMSERARGAALIYDRKSIAKRVYREILLPIAEGVS